MGQKTRHPEDKWFLFLNTGALIIGPQDYDEERDAHAFHQPPDAQSQATVPDIPYTVAESLCTQVREQVAGRWYQQQWWACKLCKMRAQNGIPQGLVDDGTNAIRCKAINQRYVQTA